MRISTVILICLSCILLTSCALEKVSETTPKFHFSVDTVFTTYKDTLILRKNNTTKAYYLDSITAGDTAKFNLDIDGVFHSLLELNISLSDTAAELIYPDRSYLDSIFIDSSDYDKGEFLLDGSKSRIPFSFQYYAKKVSKEISIDLKAVSGAEKENTGYFSLNVPIRKPKPARFYFATDSIFTQNKDTLLFYASANRIDSITVDDVANFEILINGGLFNLKEFYIDIPSTDTADIILPAQHILDSLFLSSSDYTNRKFIMNGKFKKLKFPFKYHAKEVNKTSYLEFSIISDAIEEYNKSTFRLGTPIIPVKVIEEEPETP